MKEYIERSAAMNQCAAFSDERARISKLPAADVTPVVHGEWDFEDWKGCATCTNCNVHYPVEYTNYLFELNNPFCRHCGAKMDGGNK